MNRNQLEELIAQTNDALLNSGASSYHMSIYKAFANKVRSYAEENGITEYTPEVGLAVFMETHGSNKSTYLHCMNELNDYLAFGAVNPYKGRKPRVYDIPEGFADSFESYLRYRKDNQMSEDTITGDKLYLERFFQFLQRNNINTPQNISVGNVFAFIDDLRHYYEDGMIACNVRSVRLYLKYCFDSEIIESELYSRVPTVKYCKHSKLPSANASLLGNFEIVATTIIALLIFKEKVSKKLWTAIGLITLSSIILSFGDEGSFNFSLGSLFVLGATACWGLENNCTRNISEKSTYQIVTIKGFGSGTGSLIVAIILGEKMPEIRYVLPAFLLGFVAYGLSIFTYIRAQKTLGAAKTSAYYAVAPFIGALLSFLFLRESLTIAYIIALAVMIVGTVFVVSDTLCQS